MAAQCSLQLAWLKSGEPTAAAAATAAAAVATASQRTTAHADVAVFAVHSLELPAASQLSRASEHMTHGA
jgi:hypothetical protein